MQDVRPYENTQDRAKLIIYLVPKLHQSVGQCATMRSVPPYNLGGTASYDGAI